MVETVFSREYFHPVRTVRFRAGFFGISECPLLLRAAGSITLYRKNRMKTTKRSAGIVITRRIEGVTRFLILRCYRYWDFPKGEIEPGEDPLHAARRESAEETGMTDIRLPWGDAFTETNVYARGKVARYYLGESPAGEVRLPISPELGAPEHHEFRWATYEEAQALLNDRVGAVLDWAWKRISD